MSRIKIIGSDANPVATAMKQVLNHHLLPIRTYNKTDLLILTPNACPPFPACKILLMPDELISIPTSDVAISYGMSPKCSVTLSSIGKRSVLSIQRELVTLKGKIIEPQEIPVKNSCSLSQYSLIASSAALLILGVPPERLS